MKSKCINPNNNIILELAKQLGKSKYETAIDVEIWQETNGDKIPSVSDLSKTIFAKNEHGKVIKIESSDDLINWLKDEKIITKKTESGDWFIKVSENNTGIKIQSNEELNKLTNIKQKNIKRLIRTNELFFKKYGIELLKLDLLQKGVVKFNKEAIKFLNNPKLNFSINEENENNQSFENNKFKNFIGSNSFNSKLALEKISKSSNAMSKIAKKLLRNELIVDIEIIDVDHFNKDNMPKGTLMSSNLEEDFQGDGFYNHKTRKIYIAKGASADVSALLLHEILHAQTSHYIATHPNSEAVKHLSRILQYLKKQEKEGNLNTTYPITDLDELLVGVFTNAKFIKELKLFPASNKNFKSVWDEILQIIKSIFNITEISLLDELFYYSSQIVEDSIDNFNDDKFNSELLQDTFFSKQEGKQKEISNKLDVLANKATNDSDNYYIEGIDTPLLRVSNYIKKEIGNFFKGIKDPSVLEWEKIQMDAGTIVHAIQANIIKEVFPEYNKVIDVYPVTEDLKELESILRKQLIPYIQAAKDRGSIMKAEVVLGNLKSKRGGTTDLLEITPEGNYYVYDLKTRYKPDTAAFRRFNKIVEWSKQTNEYNQFLEEGDVELGIEAGKVLGTLILELNIEPKGKQVQYVGTADFVGLPTAEQFLKGKTLKQIVDVAPTFIRTKDDKVNEFIEKLMQQIEKLANYEKGTDFENKNKLLYSKLELLQELQLKQDLNKLADHGIIELSYIQTILDKKEPLSKENQMFIEEQLELYSHITKYIEKIPEELKIKIYDIRNLAENLNDEFKKQAKQMIIDGANGTNTIGVLNKFGLDLFSAFKDISWIKRMTGGVSDIENGLVAVAVEKTNASLEKAREKVQLMAERIMEAKTAWEKEFGKVDYSLLIEGKPGYEHLVNQHTAEFFEAKKKADASSNWGWYADNTTFDKDKMIEFRDKELLKLEALEQSLRNQFKMQHTNRTENEINMMVADHNKEVMKKWDADNKSNISKYYIPKKQWLNPKWTSIKQKNKEQNGYKDTSIEKFFDLYSSYIKAAQELFPGQEIKNGFIANFESDFIERTAKNGLLGAVKGNWSGIFDSVELGYDEAYGEKDINTGESVRYLTVRGVNNKVKDKSLDLASSLFKLMESVYRTEELKEIETFVYNVKNQLKVQPYQAVDALRNVVKPKTSEGVFIPASHTLKMFEAWEDATFYGVSKKKDSAFMVKGNGFTDLIGILKKGDEKKISIGATVDNFLHYTSLRNLGFNIYAPIVNLLGGTLNMYMTGNSGRFYTKKDMTEAMNLVLGGKTNFPNEEVQKTKLILDYLGLDLNEFSRNLSDDLSSIKLKKLSSKYNSMALMRESENVLREAGAIASIKSGLNGVKWEDFKVVDGKLVTELDIFQKSQIKQKISYINTTNIGGINANDLMEAKTYIVGRMLMQHRSWLSAMFYKRFGNKQINFVIGDEIEGRYRTAYRLFSAYYTKSKRENLTQMERANMKEAAMEALLILTIGIMLKVMKAGFDDDDKKETWYKVADKVNSRVFSEILFFADPSFESQYKILLSPAASLGTVGDVLKFVSSAYKEASEPEEQLTRNKPGTKFIKLFPGANKMESWLDDLGYFDEK
jgi:hypothetical protein